MPLSGTPRALCVDAQLAVPEPLSGEVRLAVVPTG